MKKITFLNTVYVFDKQKNLIALLKKDLDLDGLKLLKGPYSCSNTEELEKFLKDLQEFLKEDIII